MVDTKHNTKASQDEGLGTMSLKIRDASLAYYSGDCRLLTSHIPLLKTQLRQHQANKDSSIKNELRELYIRCVLIETYREVKTKSLDLMEATNLLKRLDRQANEASGYFLGMLRYLIDLMHMTHHQSVMNIVEVNEKLGELMAQALRQFPNNPEILLAAADVYYYCPENYGGSKTKARELVKQAMAIETQEVQDLLIRTFSYILIDRV